MCWHSFLHVSSQSLPWRELSSAVFSSLGSSFLFLGKPQYSPSWTSSWPCLPHPRSSSWLPDLLLFSSWSLPHWALHLPLSFSFCWLLLQRRRRSLLLVLSDLCPCFPVTSVWLLSLPQWFVGSQSLG